jgi:hypothetical protein
MKNGYHDTLSKEENMSVPRYYYPEKEWESAGPLRKHDPDEEVEPKTPAVLNVGRRQPKVQGMKTASSWGQVAGTPGKMKTHHRGV